jgi:hypothetical protein
VCSSDLSAGPGTTGAAGAMGVAGASGAAGAPPASPPRPLPISAVDAVTRLARVVWNDVPDAYLLGRATDGSIATTADLADLVRTMLADPRAANGVRRFYDWWLHLDRVATVTKDANLYPTFTPDLATDMVAETERFGVAETLERRGTFTTLLESPSSFLNARLAAVYGVAGVTGDDLQPLDLDPTQRAGLLTQPALLVQGTNLTDNDPSLRGFNIDGNFYCLRLPAPPPGENSFPRPASGVSVRQALTAAVSQASCAACHAFTDQQGYALENFDAIGRWRTIDNGAPIDLSGLKMPRLDPTSNGIDIADGTPVASPVELAKVVAGDASAQRCFVRQWFAFSMGGAAPDVDAQVTEATYGRWSAEKLDLQALVVDVLTSDTFLAP